MQGIGEKASDFVAAPTPTSPVLVCRGDRKVLEQPPAGKQWWVQRCNRLSPRRARIPSCSSPLPAETRVCREDQELVPAREQRLVEAGMMWNDVTRGFAERGGSRRSARDALLAETRHIEQPWVRCILSKQLHMALAKHWTSRQRRTEVDVSEETGCPYFKGSPSCLMSSTPVTDCSKLLTN